MGAAGGRGWTPQWVAVCGSMGSGTGARVLVSKGGTRYTAKTRRDHADRETPDCDTSLGEDPITKIECPVYPTD